VGRGRQKLPISNLPFTVTSTQNEFSLREQKANWLLDQLNNNTLGQTVNLRLFKEGLKEFEVFEPFWYSNELQVLRGGLLVLKEHRFLKIKAQKGGLHLSLSSTAFI
jgi:hypothetical protein